MAAPPSYRRRASSRDKKWTDEDISDLADRVADLETFAERANDFFHAIDVDESGDTDEEQKLLRELLLQGLKEKLKKPAEGDE